MVAPGQEHADEKSPTRAPMTPVFPSSKSRVRRKLEHTMSSADTERCAGSHAVCVVNLVHPPACRNSLTSPTTGAQLSVSRKVRPIASAHDNDNLSGFRHAAQQVQ